MSADKMECLRFLLGATIDQPVSGAIEQLYEGGHLTPEQIAVIERFTSSSDIDNRYEALIALVHYGARADLDCEAVGLLVSGLVRDNNDALFGAISLLSMMAQSGNVRADRILHLLRIDKEVRHELQLSP